MINAGWWRVFADGRSLETYACSKRCSRMYVDDVDFTQ